MAKKDNKNDLPIEFEIPKWGVRGSKIPKPINQPYWKYTDSHTKGRPGLAEALLVGFIVFMVASFLFVLISASNKTLEMWFLIVGLGGYLIFIIYTFVRRFFQPKK